MVGGECQLAPEQLRRTFDPQTLGIATTEHLKPLERIIGQARAVAALRFGLGIQEIGFHIYVAEPPGSGKMTALRAFLEEVAQRKAPPVDPTGTSSAAHSTNASTDACGSLRSV